MRSVFKLVSFLALHSSAFQHYSDYCSCDLLSTYCFLKMQFSLWIPAEVLDFCETVIAPLVRKALADFDLSECCHFESWGSLSEGLYFAFSLALAAKKGPTFWWWYHFMVAERVALWVLDVFLLLHVWLAVSFCFLDIFWKHYWVPALVFLELVEGEFPLTPQRELAVYVCIHFYFYMLNVSNRFVMIRYTFNFLQTSTFVTTVYYLVQYFVGVYIVRSRDDAVLAQSKIGSLCTDLPYLSGVCGRLLSEGRDHLMHKLEVHILSLVWLNSLVPILVVLLGLLVRKVAKFFEIFYLVYAQDEVSFVLGRCLARIM